MCAKLQRLLLAALTILTMFEWTYRDDVGYGLWLVLQLRVFTCITVPNTLTVIESSVGYIL